MRYFPGLLLWVGMFAAMREWMYARKHGRIALSEKLWLILALPLGFAAQLAAETAGFRPGNGAMVALATGGVLNGWALKRRLQRKSP